MIQNLKSEKNRKPLFQEIRHYSEYLLFVTGPVGFIVALASDYVSGVSALNNWFLQHSNIIGCLLHLILIYFAFHTSDYKLINIYDNYINEWYKNVLWGWRIIWMSWGFQYTTLLVMEFLEINSTIVFYFGDFHSFLNIFFILFNFLTGLAFIYTSIFFYKTTTLEKGTIIFVLPTVVILVIITLIIKNTQLISAIFISISMMFLFGRLDSYYLSNNIFAIGVLFLYAISQIGVIYIGNSNNPVVKSVLIYSVFIFKCIFYWFGIYKVRENELIKYYQANKYKYS